jgi:N-acetyl-gamma-glutamyl-phosphate reductase
MTSRQSAGKKVSDVHTFLKGYVEIDFSEKLDSDLDLVFVATPHGIAMTEIPGILQSGTKAIDMSGDYRLHDPNEYEKWYSHKHTDLENLEKSVYGLPELNREKIKNANLVANPGCYATATILAMAPLFASGLAEEAIVDAKSGTSGAGMVPSARTHHPFCGESIIPYSVGTHRHAPEIEMALRNISGSSAEVLFAPHLLPIVRGILSMCYLSLTRETEENEIVEIYEKWYGNERFVHFVDEPSIRATIGSNHCQVGAKKIGKRIVATGTLDNLVKGASGQAVQCANLMLGLDEKEGLDFPGLGV